MSLSQIIYQFPSICLKTDGALDLIFEISEGERRELPALTRSPPLPQSYFNSVLCPITRRDRTFHARDVTQPRHTTASTASSAFLRCSRVFLRHFSIVRRRFMELERERVNSGLKCCKKKSLSGEEEEERTGAGNLI